MEQLSHAFSDAEAILAKQLDLLDATAAAR